MYHASRYPIANYVSYDKFTNEQAQFLQKIFKTQDPTYFKEAIKHPHWIEAMHKEIKALEDNETWSLVSLPSNKKAIGC